MKSSDSNCPCCLYFLFYYSFLILFCPCLKTVPPRFARSKNTPQHRSKKCAHAGTWCANVVGARCSTLVKRLACVEQRAPGVPARVLDTSIPTYAILRKRFFVNFKCRDAATASSPFDLLPDRAGQMKNSYFSVFPPKRWLCLHFFCIGSSPISYKSST